MDENKKLKRYLHLKKLNGLKDEISHEKVEIGFQRDAQNELHNLQEKNKNLKEALEVFLD